MSITISGDYTLRFTNNDMDLHEEYQKKKKELALEIYKKLKERNGIFASNQNKYVSSVEELNKYDDKRMERLASEYLRNHSPFNQAR